MHKATIRNDYMPIPVAYADKCEIEARTKTAGNCIMKSSRKKSAAF